MDSKYSSPISMGGLETGAQLAGDKLGELSSTKPDRLMGQNIKIKPLDCVTPKTGGGLTVNTALELRMELTGLATNTA